MLYYLQFISLSGYFEQQALIYLSLLITMLLSKVHFFLNFLSLVIESNALLK